MAPSCVVVWQLAGQYGVVWAMCMWDMMVGLSLCVPSFGSMCQSPIHKFDVN